MRCADAASWLHVSQARRTRAPDRLAADVEHVSDAPAEGMFGHQRILGSACRRGLGRRVRPARAGFPTWCRSGSAPSRPGRACRVIPRSPSRCPGSLSVVWPRSPSAISWARAHSSLARDDLGHQLIRSAVSALTRSSLPINAIRSVSPRPTRRISPIGSSARHQARADVGVEERRVLRADHDVGLVDEVERARGAHALHRAHDRLPHLLPLGAEKFARILVVPHVVGLPVGRLDVEAALNARLPAARSTTALTVSSSLTTRHTSRHLLAHRAVERVERSGRFSVTVGDVVDGVDVERDRLEGGGHRHCQFGARFSMNAYGPSGRLRCSRARGTSRRGSRLHSAAGRGSCGWPGGCPEQPVAHSS